MVPSPGRTILYVLLHAQRPGEPDVYETHHRERFLVRHARSLGFCSRLYMLGPTGTTPKLDEGCETRFFPNDSWTSMLRQIEEDAPALIVFKGMGYRLPAWLVARSRPRFRFAFVVGGTARDAIEPLSSFVLAESDEQVSRYFSGRRERGTVAVMPKMLLPGDFRPVRERDFDIVSVGSLTSRKNHRALLPLFGRYRIAIVGDGPRLTELEAAAARHGDSVYLPGRLPRSGVLDVISRSRLMVHSSTMEGLPRVFGEAFACGVPVVALRRAIASGFAQGVHGLLVGETELVDAVGNLLSDQAGLEAMGRNALEFARRAFHPDAVARAAEGMYEHVFTECGDEGARWRGIGIRRARWLAAQALRKTAKSLGVRRLVQALRRR